MKSSKTFNNLSDKFKAKIPKLKPNESVVFQMLNGVPNPEPDEKERSKDPILYPKMQLLTQFRVFDPYQLNEAKEEVGGYVDVGCVDAWIGDNPTKMRTFVPGAGMYSRFPGKFELKGGNVKDEELFEILWMSPQREDSPCPDSSVEVIFRIVDQKSESKHSTNRFDKLMKAVEYAKGIDAEKARAVMAALNQPEYQDEEVLMAKVKDLARTNPDEFITTYESSDTPIMGVLKDALNKGVLKHDFASGDVTMGGVVLTTFKMNDVGELLPTLAKWVNSAENGKEVLNNIKGRLKKEDKKAAV